MRLAAMGQLVVTRAVLSDYSFLHSAETCLATGSVCGMF